jgi:hypothetical protein
MLPNGDNAFVDRDKLTEYCLNPEHPRGRNKARVFAASLGITIQHAEFLRQALLVGAQTQPATESELDDYGQRYVVDFPLDGPTGRAMVRSSWIIRADEDFPRLTSCYVL